MSSPSTHLIASPSHKPSLRADASTAGAVRTGKAGTEAKDSFAQLMKNYGGGQPMPPTPEPSHKAAPNKEAAKVETGKPPSPATPSTAPAAARPLERKSEQQRQEQKLAQKNVAQSDGGKTRPVAMAQHQKNKASEAGKADATQAQTAALDVDSKTLKPESIDQPARARTEADLSSASPIAGAATTAALFAQQTLLATGLSGAAVQGDAMKQSTDLLVQTEAVDARPGLADQAAAARNATASAAATAVETKSSFAATAALFAPQTLLAPGLPSLSAAALQGDGTKPSMDRLVQTEAADARPGLADKAGELVAGAVAVAATVAAPVAAPGTRLAATAEPDSGEASDSSAALQPTAPTQARSAVHAQAINASASPPVRQAAIKPSVEQTQTAIRDFGSEFQVAQSNLAAGPNASKTESVSFGSLMAAAGVAAPAALEARSEITTARQVSISQALTEPGFVPEMAARLSVLAADGIQEARLHLNPAEMGPVSVQIIVDGQQAQVSFHAEHEQTRAVLEQSLPDLAAALREAGLTLSGGGVFQQPGDQNRPKQQGTDADTNAGTRPGSGRSTDMRLSPPAGPVPLLIKQGLGVVDLYA